MVGLIGIYVAVVLVVLGAVLALRAVDLIE